MNGGKCLLWLFCIRGSLEAFVFGAAGFSQLLTHKAWHIALISSRTDASRPKQTHTQPDRVTAQVQKICKVFYTELKHAVVLWKKCHTFTYHFSLLRGKACCCSSRPNEVHLGWKREELHKTGQNVLLRLFYFSKKCIQLPPYNFL